MFQTYGYIIKRMSGAGQAVDETLKQEQEQQQQDSKRHEETSTEYLVHHWLEAVFAYFQVVVLWHEPQISVRAISALLSLFLLLTHFAPRFYAVVLIAIFIYNLNKFWFRHVWPGIRVPPGSDREEEMRLDVDRFTYLHPQLMTLDELRYHIRNLTRLGKSHLQHLLQLRREKPAQFCLRICFVLSCTAYLGRIIGGLTLVFSALVIIMSAPGIYARLFPEKYKHLLKQRYQSLVFADELANDEEEKEQQGVEGENQDVETSEKTTSMAPISKEALATSVATTMKTIESLFGNLRKKSTDSTTSTSAIETTTFHLEEPQRHRPQLEVQTPSFSSDNVLSNLREDGAKVLYNLIDVTLMRSSDKDRRAKRTDSTGSHQNDRPEAATRDSEQSTATDSNSLAENEQEQDDGFVML